MIRNGLLLFFLAILSYAGPKTKQTNAIDRVFELMKKYGKKVTNLKLECVYFLEEGSNTQGIDIAARERHNKTCGGDPHIELIVARFRVEKKTHKVLIYDAVEDTYQPFDSKWLGFDEK